MTQNIQFRIEQLRAKNFQRTLEALLVLVLALFMTALLPSLLVRYVYASQQLFEEPQVLQYIPLVSFVIGIGYFLFTVVTNLMREAQAMRLEREMLGVTSPTLTPAVKSESKVSDLQAALKRVGNAAEKAPKAEKKVATKSKKNSRRK